MKATVILIFVFILTIFSVSMPALAAAHNCLFVSGNISTPTGNINVPYYSNFSFQGIGKVQKLKIQEITTF
jgi:hypothetical protein